MLWTDGTRFPCSLLSKVCFVLALSLRQKKKDLNLCHNICVPSTATISFSLRLAQYTMTTQNSMIEEEKIILLPNLLQGFELVWQTNTDFQSLERFLYLCYTYKWDASMSATAAPTYKFSLTTSTYKNWNPLSQICSSKPNRLAQTLKIMYTQLFLLQILYNWNNKDTQSIFRNNTSWEIANFYKFRNNIYTTMY